MRADGTLMPNGAKRKLPPWRSSSEPNTLGESKRGTHSQSIAPSGATSAPVWQFDKKAYSAIGGNGESAAALCGASDCGEEPTALAASAFRPLPAPTLEGCSTLARTIASSVKGSPFLG